MRTVLTALALLGAAPAVAAELQVPATVMRVVDGDTIVARAMIWPDVFTDAHIRVRGVDTPELHGKCPAEREAALAAKRWVEAQPNEVTLSAISADKYGGRYDATVTLVDGRDLAQSLIKEGLGRPYNGSRRAGWCP